MPADQDNQIPPTPAATTDADEKGTTTDDRRPGEHPLGPLVRIKPLEMGGAGRVYAGLIALAAGVILGIAVSLTPTPDRLDTHQKMLLYRAPCGFVTMTGFPCPTCGMTTAFAFTVRGRFLLAMRSQLAGFLLAIATIVAGVVSVFAVLTGRRPAINWYRVNPMTTLWIVVAIFVASWAGKVVFGLANGTLPVGR